MAFVDAGYLITGARKALGVNGALRIDGDELAIWAAHAEVTARQKRLLRVYVYDAEYAPASEHHAAQRASFDELAQTAQIRLRLGHLVERQGGSSRASFEQKGVDTLLVLDMVRLAQARAFDIALVVAGDRDLAEAMRVIADDYARQVAHYSVVGSDPAKELRQVADSWGEIDARTVEAMVKRPGDPSPEGHPEAGPRG